MSTITTLNPNDNGSTSRTTINTNFSTLNTDKAESSTVTAHTSASTGVHGVSGTLVGTTDVQTLTNKTLTSPTITNKTSTGTDSGAETLTNKTISAASNTISGITESMLSTSDVTTLNASASKHGFLPKLENSGFKFLKDDGTWAVAGGQFAAGVVSDLSTTSAANNDVTVTLSFQPSMIKLHYFIQGWDGAGATAYTGRKGIAVYVGTTLAFDNPLWIAPSTSSPLSGDNGTPSNINQFTNTSNSTSAPATSGTGPNTITLSINSVSSTGFVIRRLTTINDGTKTVRAKIAYEAYA